MDELDEHESVRLIGEKEEKSNGEPGRSGAGPENDWSDFWDELNADSNK